MKRIVIACLLLVLFSGCIGKTTGDTILITDDFNAADLNVADLNIVFSDTNWQTSYPTFDANMALRYVKQVDGNLWYVKISDSNNPSWLDYTVIANPPWGAGSSMDTNWQTSYPLFDANMALRYVKQTDGNAWYVKQSDGNVWYVKQSDGNIWYITQTDGNLWYSKLNDSNNTGRLDWGVIANPPVTGNYWDSNVNQTGLNGNKTGTFDLVTNGVIGAGYYQSTVGTGTAPFFISSTTNVIDLNADMVDGLHGTDINGALLRFLLNTDVNKVYVRQVDGNQWYILVSDKNNYGTYNIRAIADLNLQYYSQLDANQVLSRITDTNAADILRLLISDTNNIGRINYKTIADLNNAYYSQLDANRILYKQTDVNTIFSKITDVNGAINLRAKSTDINGTYLNALIGGTVAKDLNITTGANRGISIRSDTNRICFPAITCEMYIDYNGTAFILGS